MPDANKLEKLREIAYRVLPVCSTCKYARFAPGSSFGACEEHSYKHAKHTGSLRELSIHVAGTCDEHLTRVEVVADLQRSGFDAFLPGR